MANTSPQSLNLTSLDYETIRADLTAVMANTAEFRGYDFENGPMAAIIKVLAYKTWQDSWYLNQVASEQFIDSAQIRSSVISHAKALGYTPRSAKSSVATVRMTWEGENPTYLLQKGQIFTALVRGAGSLTFSIDETRVVSSANDSFTADIDLYEGTYVSDVYVVDGNPDQPFILTNDTVDMDSITVAVYEDTELEGTTYTRATTLLGVNELSKIWFLQMNWQGKYEILFGDDVAGRRPTTGARVVIDYRITKGEEGNGAKVFSPGFNPFPGDAFNIEVETIDVSAGGASPETTESIRYNAPRHFRVQERAITEEDYAILLKQEFPEIRDARSYGGDTLSPPKYGRIYVAVDLSDADGLPDSRKRAYEQFLQTKCGLTFRPVVVSPDRSYVTVTSTVVHNLSVSTMSPETVTALVIDAIESYTDSVLGVFAAKLRYSKLVSAIDDAHASILSNQTDLTVYKLMEPTRGTPQNIRLTFGFPLKKTPTDSDSVPDEAVAYTVWTSQFTTSSGLKAIIADDGMGNLRLVTSVGSGTPTYSSNILGTVDYTTGIVAFAGFSPVDFDGATMRVYVKSASLDVEPPAGQVLSLGDETDITVTQVRE